jgi:hypothetical protein
VKLGALIAGKLAGHYNVKEYGVKGDGVTNDSDAFQSMINQIRSDALTGSLNVMPVIEVPSGLYILDKQIIMSPYIKFKSLGLVAFRITFNGSAFWIKPDPSDSIYTSTTVNQDKSRNAWNRGRYFDGNFVFVTNLDRASTGNATVALEIGDTNIGSNKALPVSRYEISQVNVYGLAKAIKLNTVNNYLGTFINCHWEMNNTAVWFLTPTDGTQYNSGENMRFENCIIAGCTQPSFLLESPGVDIVISGTSFDFNASPLIHSKASGTSVRLQHCYVEKIGDGTGDQLLYKSAAQNLGDSWGRSSIYIDNLIMYLKRPAKMFQNEPNGTGNFIKVFLDINGIELRYDEGRPYDTVNRYLVPTTEKFNVLRRRIISSYYLQ